MKLKKFLKMVDSVDDIILWSDNDNEKEPFYKGCILYVPYYLLNHKIARMEDGDEPICIVHYENEYGTKMAAYNVVLEDD